MTTPDINFILRKSPRSSKYGAPMGDKSFHHSDSGPMPLYLQRIRMVDGDYGADGTYWGGGRDTEPLWCAFNGGFDDEYGAAFGARIYVRAWNRREALHRVVADFPDATFIRG